MDLLASVLLIVGAYLLGSVPSAYYLASLLRGIDIRKYGSGNIGISNFSVHAGKRWAVILILSDIFIKGMAPVVIASDKVLGLGLHVEVAAGFASIFGHNWSVWLRFSGGRGMATVLGVLAALHYPLVIAYGLVAGIGWILTRGRDSAVLWAIAALTLPLWAVAFQYVPIKQIALPKGVELVAFCIGFLMVTAAKRLTSNRSTAGGGQTTSRRRLIWNRLVFDRDIDSRQDWVYRSPQT